MRVFHKNNLLKAFLLAAVIVISLIIVMHYLNQKADRVDPSYKNAKLIKNNSLNMKGQY